MNKRFTPGMSFESNTVYEGDKKEYHIYPRDCIGFSDAVYYPGMELRAAFLLRGLKNVTIDLRGAKLVFHGRITPFYITHCGDIKLENFSIDYDRPFYTQGEIADLDKNFIEIKIPDAFPFRLENGDFIAAGDGWEKHIHGETVLFQPFDKNTLAPAFGAGCILGTFGAAALDKNPPLPIKTFRTEKQANGSVRFYGEFPSSWLPGQILAFTHEERNNHGFLAQYSEGVSVKNVRLIHGSSFGFLAFFCKDIDVNGLDMYLDRGSKGVVTVNADSIHCSHCWGRVNIENCIFENMLDDAFNAHNNYTVAKEAKGYTLDCVFKGAYYDRFKFYRTGDVFSVYNGRTAEIKGSFSVKGAVYTSANEFTLETGEDTACVRSGDIIEFGRQPEITIRNCVTGRNRPRGFLLSSSAKTLVENCVFNNCSCAIHFTGDTSYWYESGPVRDVTIRNCYFNDTGYCSGDYAIISDPNFEASLKEPCYHKNIRILNNVFKTFTGGALHAKYTDGIVFKNNRIIRSADYPESNVPALQFEQCGPIETGV
jgi:hypothetical protein